jgi:hypothetical protein
MWAADGTARYVPRAQVPCSHSVEVPKRLLEALRDACNVWRNSMLAREVHFQSSDFAVQVGELLQLALQLGALAALQGPLRARTETSHTEGSCPD